VSRSTKSFHVINCDNISLKSPIPVECEDMVNINDTLLSLQEEEQAHPSDGDHDDH
jgi:hypothetical protein